MNRVNKFVLKSAKEVTNVDQVDESIEKDLIPYKKFLERKGYKINSVYELFDSYDRDEKDDELNVIQTGSILIARWTWTFCWEEVELLDISTGSGCGSETGDGIICIKSKETGEFYPFCDDNNSELKLNYNTEYDKILSEDLEYFANLRCFLDERGIPMGDDYYDELTGEFANSDEGKESIAIAKAAGVYSGV